MPDLNTQTEINPYTFEELRTIKDVKSIYSEGITTRDAWLFLSLEGEHGTALSLDDIELIFQGSHPFTDSINGKYWITVLIVWPKKTSAQILQFAEVMIDQEDVSWLRDKVRETLIEVEASQYGNT